MSVRRINQPDKQNMKSTQRINLPNIYWRDSWHFALKREMELLKMGQLIAKIRRKDMRMWQVN